MKKQNQKNIKRNDINTIIDTKKQEPKMKLHLSLLTILLVIFLAQLFWGIVVNSAKIYSLKSKIAKLENINKIAEKKNQFLREELEKYTSNSGVEALARNRLQFSKDDETLIIIKTPHESGEF